MPKFLMECIECNSRFKTKEKRFRRQCPVCKIETTFIEIEKEPVTQKGTPFDIMCLRCRTVRHVQSIPKQCRCGQRFERHSENLTLTDVIYNAIVGSSKDKGYMRVTVGRDRFVWWTPPKDEFGDDIDPLIGDSKRIGHYSHQNHIDSMRVDDLRPVETTTSIFRRRNIK